jgi:hypothetical protein
VREPVAFPSFPVRRASKAIGEKSLIRAAANSIANGKPSKQWQISPTAGADSLVKVKSSFAALARSMKSRTAAQRESSAVDSVSDCNCHSSGSARGGNGNSCSPRTRRSSRLVTRILRLGAAASRSATKGAAPRICSKLSSTNRRLRSRSQLLRISSSG